MPVEHTQQAAMIAPPQVAVPALQVLEFSACQRGKGREQRRQASPRTNEGHQVDGRIASLHIAAMTGSATGMDGQLVFVPTPLPMGQSADGHAQVLGNGMARPTTATGPMVERDCAAANGTISFAPLALPWPATFHGLCGTRIHQFTGLG
jgi:hypothetical protein